MDLLQGGSGRIRRLPTLCFRSVREGGGGREGHRRHGPDQDIGELNAELSCSGSVTWYAVGSSVADRLSLLLVRIRLSILDASS
jgi:hypothetical protein